MRRIAARSDDHEIVAHDVAAVDTKAVGHELVFSDAIVNQERVGIAARADACAEPAARTATRKATKRIMLTTSRPARPGDGPSKPISANQPWFTIISLLNVANVAKSLILTKDQSILLVVVVA